MKQAAASKNTPNKNSIYLSDMQEEEEKNENALPSNIDYYFTHQRPKQDSCIFFPQPIKFNRFRFDVSCFVCIRNYRFDRSLIFCV